MHLPGSFGALFDALAVAGFFAKNGRVPQIFPRSQFGQKLKPGWVRTCCCDASGAFGFTSPGTASRALAAPAALNSSSVAQPLKATIPQARKAKYHLFTAG